MKGQEKVKDTFIVEIAVNQKLKWGQIWWNAKLMDKFHNGTIFKEELEEIFME